MQTLACVAVVQRPTHLADAKRPIGHLENPDHRRLKLAVPEATRPGYQGVLLSAPGPPVALREGRQSSLKCFWRV